MDRICLPCRAGPAWFVPFPGDGHPSPVAQTLSRRSRALAESAANAVQLELQSSGGKAYLTEHGSGFARRWRESAFVPIVTPSLVQLRAELQRQKREATA